MSDRARDADSAASPDKPDAAVQGFRAAEKGSGTPSKTQLEQEIRELKQLITALQSESAKLLGHDPNATDSASLAIIAKNRILILAAEARLRKYRARPGGAD